MWVSGPTHHRKDAGSSNQVVAGSCGHETIGVSMIDRWIQFGGRDVGPSQGKGGPQLRSQIECVPHRQQASKDRCVSNRRRAGARGGDVPAFPGSALDRTGRDIFVGEGWDACMSKRRVQEHGHERRKWLHQQRATRRVSRDDFEGGGNGPRRLTKRGGVCGMTKGLQQLAEAKPFCYYPCSKLGPLLMPVQPSLQIDPLTRTFQSINQSN